MKHILTLLLILSTIAGNAQFIVGERYHMPDKQTTIDYSVLSVNYHYKYMNDTVKKSYRNDLFALEIGLKSSRFYSLYAKRIDSITYVQLHSDAERIQNKSWMSRDQYANYFDILMNYPAKNILLYIFQVCETSYRYYEEIPKMDWQVQEGTKKILGYECKTATTEFRGNRFTVWYAPALEYSLGPWKFNGLPGLVLEVYDDRRFFHFLAKSIDSEKKPIYTYKHNYKEVSRKEILKMQELMYKSPSELSEKYGGKTFMGTIIIDRKKGPSTVSKEGLTYPYIPPLEKQ